MQPNISQYQSADLFREDLIKEINSIEDSVQREQLMIQLKDRAKQLGCKRTFESFIKACRDKYSAKSSTAIPGNNKTHFSDAPEMNCGKYIADDSGIYTIVNGERICICPHPIYPVCILNNANTGKCKTRLRFTVRGRSHVIDVDRKTLASHTAILDLADYGIQVTSITAKHLCSYLTEVEALNPEMMIERCSVSQLGWYGEESRFVPYDDTVTFDDSFKSLDLLESISSEGNYDAWISAVSAIRKSKNTAANISIIASLASVLVYPTSMLPFIINMCGPTGTGKTVSLMVAASVWGKPSQTALITDSRSTTTAMEIKLNVLNDLPMMVDDMSSIERQLDNRFDDYIYMLCSGRGKDRSNKNLTLRGQESWNNIILTNSEHPLSACAGGAVNRVIDVNVASPLYADPHSIVEIINNNYGFCGEKFVNAIAIIGFDEIRSRQQFYLTTLKCLADTLHLDISEKQLNPMSLILTADEICEEWIFGDGVHLDLKECLCLLKTNDVVSDDIRAFDYLNSILMQNYDHLEGSPRYSTYGETWGRIMDDSGSIAIPIAKFNEILHKGGYSSDAFKKWAVREGYIEIGQSALTKTVRINSKPIQCILWKALDECRRD